MRVPVKKRSKSRSGNSSLKRTLIEAARAAAHTKNTYLSAKYRRIAARRGGNRAALALAHTILIITYNIIKNKVPYQDLGPDYFNKLNESAIVKRSTKFLNSLGYKVIKE
ncbi:hypothetical protein EDD71_1364 [Fonticella tunisiensis]|uniref:Transposase IS116/IS110/IS902 family protein n=1 Tax=Fonticella tunisiensis TaxID=1096341 RepID=A0A4R7K5L5_9CLOT|nr:hypothetical protein EDD71_1364 [Fonticella tunisiensis]